jgi:hypothetical protein
MSPLRLTPLVLLLAVPASAEPNFKASHAL